MKNWTWLLVGMLGCGGLVGCGDDDGGTEIPDDGGTEIPEDGGMVIPDASPMTCTRTADCDDGIFCNGLELCERGAAVADARGCVPGSNPCASGRCDEAARACEGEACADSDGDGEGDVACGGTDCDDSNPDIFAAATEICDLEGVDEDCDPTTVGERDLDSDGYIDRRCCNGATCGEDCDDTRRGTNPNVPEVCDGRDNDCDGNVDEELLQSVFVDADRDLHGDPDNEILACPGRAGTSASMLDCDDTEPYANTPQVEITDGRDNDCDGTIDEDPQAVTWYPDADGDRFGDPDGVTITSSTVQPGYSILPYDCDDTNAAISPLATELCNGIDDDCDGEANFVIGVNDWEDDDGDGIPDAACAPSGGDCDDTDARTSPGAREICDLRDNDCDGTVDESCTALPGLVDVVGTWRGCIGEGASPEEACSMVDSDYFIRIESDGTWSYIEPAFGCELFHLSVRDGFGTLLGCGPSDVSRDGFGVTITATTMVWDEDPFRSRGIWTRSADTADLSSCTRVDDYRCPAGTEFPHEAWAVSSLEGVYQRCDGMGVVPAMACATTYDEFIIFGGDGTVYEAGFDCEYLSSIRSAYTEGSQVAVSECGDRHSQSIIYEVLAEGNYLQRDAAFRGRAMSETYQQVLISPPCAPSGEDRTCR